MRFPTKNFLIAGIALMLTRCGIEPKVTSPEEDPFASGERYEVELDERQRELYLPKTSVATADAAYMRAVNELLESSAKDIKSAYNEHSTTFINIVKATAWTESTWRHYVNEDGKFYVLLGDEGHAFGMMQIHDLYHEQFPDLEENVAYGAAYLATQLEKAAEDCSSGSNSGEQAHKLARRTYAIYNGGDQARCRLDDPRDERFEAYFLSNPWIEFL